MALDECIDINRTYQIYHVYHNTHYYSTWLVKNDTFLTSEWRLMDVFLSTTEMPSVTYITTYTIAANDALEMGHFWLVSDDAS